MIVAEKYQHFGAVESPAACPKCGSMDLAFPWQGRRTQLWLSRCRDCDTPIRSTIQFEVAPRRQPRARYVPDPDPQPTRPMGTMIAAAAISSGAGVREWLPYREPGEEG